MGLMKKIEKKTCQNKKGLEKSRPKLVVENIGFEPMTSTLPA
jgi:inhibitor of KinA sporulation pathway (predicted exonuclease)